MPSKIEIDSAFEPCLDHKLPNLDADRKLPKNTQFLKYSLVVASPTFQFSIFPWEPLFIYLPGKKILQVGRF